MKKRRDRQRFAAGGAATERGPTQRQLRVGEELRHALSKILREGDCRDPALDAVNITVTEVSMSPDLRNATAFVMPLAGANAACASGKSCGMPYPGSCAKARAATRLSLRRASPSQKSG